MAASAGGVLLVGLASLILVVGLTVLVSYLSYKVVWGLCWVVWKVTSGIGAAVSFSAQTVATVFRRAAGFVRGTFTDGLRVVGALLTALFVVPTCLANVFLGRWSNANHYGKALEREFREMGLALYRLVIANPIRLFGLEALTEGLEHRLPEVLAQAPGPDRPRGGPHRFPGYEIVGSLRAGGSGARLFLATPSDEKRIKFTRQGHGVPEQVVIKSFSLEDGSTLPQMLRESGALQAARKLGLVLDHALEKESFYYVMPFVPGADLSEVTARLHASSDGSGLGPARLREVMGYAAQLLETLEGFHACGLWHKDIKPTNVIVSEDGRAHLVDFGLVTPLRSAMTLTTQGTEYFRDPEMVRLALQGVKVHEVDGVKFDLYGAGALLYSMIENSFPAHGNLSRITRRCPDALRWIVRRAMADTKGRYASAPEMLADLRVVLQSEDPFALEPADLPSMGGAEVPADELLRTETFASAAGDGPDLRFAGPAPTAASGAAGRPTVTRRARRIHRGVLAATALFFVSAALGGAVIGTQQLRSGSPPPGVVHRVPLSHSHHDASHHDPALPTPAVARGTRARTSGAPDRRALVESLSEAHPFDLRYDPDQVRRLAEASFPRDFDVLVVREVPEALAPDLTGVEDTLSAYGVWDALPENASASILGIPPAGEASDGRELELLAEALNAAGVVGPELSAEAEKRLLRFLARHEDLDLVLWYTPGSEPDEIVPHFVFF